MPRSSALWREIYGDDVDWGLTEQLQAAILDATNAGNWQRSGDNKKPRPKPTPRPGITDADRGERKIGGNVVRTPAEIDAILKRVATSEEG